jgi:hypothetical protein
MSLRRISADLLPWPPGRQPEDIEMPKPDFGRNTAARPVLNPLLRLDSEQSRNGRDASKCVDHCLVVVCIAHGA